MLIAQVTDDDGVLVIASALGLKNRFAEREFNYEFPEELVNGAGDEELCSWQTHQEGDVTVTLHVGETPPPDARYLGVLRLDVGDELLILPYSQYTMACDARKGVPEDIEGLCTRLQVGPGRYGCWGRPAPIEAPPDLVDEAPLVFNVFMHAASATDKPLREVPILER